MALYLIGAIDGDASFSQTASGLGWNFVDEAGEGIYSPFNGPLITIGTDAPAETDVRDGVTYAGGLFTGNMTEPAESDVRSGVDYGANGTEFTGTLATGGGGPSSIVY